MRQALRWRREKFFLLWGGAVLMTLAVFCILLGFVIDTSTKTGWYIAAASLWILLIEMLPAAWVALKNLTRRDKSRPAKMV